MSDPIKAYGWTAMPRKVETLLATRTDATPPTPVNVNDVPLPESPLAKAIHEYAKKELAPETFNHSMRVYYYGTYQLEYITSINSHVTFQTYPSTIAMMHPFSLVSNLPAQASPSPAPHSQPGSAPPSVKRTSSPAYCTTSARRTRTSSRR
jgi:hypothetical protein